LLARADDDLVDVHPRRPGDDERDDLGDVFRRERVDALVNLLGSCLVAFEADDTELGSGDEAGIDLGHADRTAEELQAQRLADHTHAVLGGRVTGAARVGLEAGRRADVHDVAVARAFERRQQRARHANEAEDVGLPHPPPGIVGCVLDGFEALRAAGVVDEKLDLAGLLHERVDAVLVRDVERACLAVDLFRDRFDAICSAGAEDDLESVCCERFRRRGTDAAGRAGNDCALLQFP
jgi:hypothetical protein